MNETNDRPRPLAAPLIALVAGVVVVLVGWQGVLRHAEATRAVAVEASVLRAEVHERLGEAGPAVGAVGWVPYLEYTWQVGGVRAIDNNGEAQAPLTDQAEAERIVAAHPVGSTITVYYDPDEPFRGSLRGGGGGAVLAATIAAIAGVLAAAGLALFVVTRRARQRPDG